MLIFFLEERGKIATAELESLPKYDDDDSDVDLREDSDFDGDVYEEPHDSKNLPQPQSELSGTVENLQQPMEEIHQEDSQRPKQTLAESNKYLH